MSSTKLPLVQRELVVGRHFLWVGRLVCRLVTSAARACPHCGAALPLPDDLSQLKLACPYCKRDYLVTDVVAAELVAAQRVNAGVCGC